MTVPFEAFLIFSTNLKPDHLGDEAFLRRIQYKMLLRSPEEAEFESIFKSFCIWSDPISSAGFGGRAPDVMMCRPLSCSMINFFTCSSVKSLERIVLRPSRLFRWKIECSRGRRMSASMTRTFAPVWARLRAAFTAVVVFPSAGMLEVTSRVFGAWPADESNTEVRRWR